MNLRHCLRYLVLISSLLSSGVGFAAWYSDDQAIMGTKVSVTLWHLDGANAQAAIAEVMADMRAVERQFSPYIVSSELAKLNQTAAKDAVKISPELALLIKQSIDASAESGGAFDITYASLGWYYDYRKQIQPTAEQRKALQPAINYRWLSFNEQQSTLKYLHKNVRIDLGGIAKGYATDRAIALLRSRGIKHASVSAGGDSKLLGDRKGRPWLIGIKHPRPAKKTDAVVLTLPLSDIAVSTSGDYERYFIDSQSGERVHHIINPRTGRSANEVMSVTVLGPEGLATDPLSTSVFVLGVEEGLALVNRKPGLDCVIIDRKGQVHYSEGLVDPSAP